jgi:replicative DNA helicase
VNAAIDSEREVLGAIIGRNEFAADAAALVDAEDFSLDAHRVIYATALEEIADGHPIDPITLKQALEARRQLTTAGGEGYLFELPVGAIWVSSSVQHHARVVRDKALMRRLALLAESLLTRAQEPNQKAERLITTLTDELLSLTAAQRTLTVQPVGKVMQRVREELEAQSKNDGLIGMPTGIPALDEKTGGVRQGELWVVGALPSRGKTALGVQIGAANVRAGNPTLVFSLEMSAGQVARRLLANFSGVDATRIRNPRWFGREEWSKVLDSAAEIAEWPLWIDDAGSLTTSQLTTRARLFIRRHGVKLVIVDYLMLVQEPKEREQRLKAARIADTMRRIAKEENVGVVLLSQLKRLAGGINAEPTMADLKESGDIEAAAHVVLLIHMPIGDDHQPTGEERILIGKQREGRIGFIPVHYDRKRLLFEDRVAHDRRDSKRAAAGDR